MINHAEIIRSCRKYRGLTQKGLAQRSGISAATVASVESGARSPSTYTFETLLNSMGFGLKIVKLEDEINELVER